MTGTASRVRVTGPLAPFAWILSVIQITNQCKGKRPPSRRPRAGAFGRAGGNPAIRFPAKLPRLQVARAG